MKNLLIFFVCIPVFLLTSCSQDDKDDDQYGDYLVARPLTVSKAEFQNGVDVIAPRPVEESGKIYAYQDYIFVNDMYKGVHVIDNSNPASPRKVSFIKIAGNVDISVKDNFLYADSLSDLIVLDISDIDNIQIVKRLLNVLGNNVIWPAEVDFFEYEDIDYDNEVLLGWEVVTERRLKVEVQPWRNDGAFAEFASDASIGQGGSLARFRIVADYLYAVDSHSINIFDISDLENPQDLQEVYAGFDIETIFNQGEHLFLGSMRGMYIYNITNPAVPEFISEFQHGTACDPVVVDGGYAYVTLRGGNSCGATESGLFIIDISSLSNPVLTSSYPMEEPYGLGIKGNMLFVCDGTAGLKVYDKSDIENLVELRHIEDLVTYDVIPLEESLLMVGDGTLYQYEYLVDDIREISSLQLD
jgi:hypothetical protein